MRSIQSTLRLLAFSFATAASTIAPSTAILTATTLPGCATTQQQTPRDLVFKSQEAFILILTAATEARNTGIIDEQSWQEDWLPAINQGNDILEEMLTQIIDGNEEEALDLRTALNTIIRTLNTARTENGSF